MIELTKSQMLQIRLLSDEKLYQDAIPFIRENGTIKNSQIAGLENIACTANEFSKIMEFSNHQAQKKGENAAFYQAVSKYLTKLQQELKENREFIPEPDTLSKKQLKEYMEFYGLLLVREFIHHLSAQHRYQAQGA